MTPKEYKKYYRIVDQILWEDWDPIGVNSDKDWSDEYRDYVPAIVSQVMKGASALEISSCLVEITVDSIGFDPISPDAYLEVAQKIIKETRTFRF